MDFVTILRLPLYYSCCNVAQGLSVFQFGEENLIILTIVITQSDSGFCFAPEYTRIGGRGIGGLGGKGGAAVMVVIETVVVAAATAADVAVTIVNALKERPAYQWDRSESPK